MNCYRRANELTGSGTSAILCPAVNTIRLFDKDAYRSECRARVVQRLTMEGRPAVVLDRTCFYPSSGGQPADRGEIDGVAVLDVCEQDGTIVHVLAADVPRQHIVGRIDWSRRFDHMQQHTGQHILSQAFLRLLGAQTISFHLGDAVSTIDLELPALSPADAERVEDLANAVVFENRPVRTLVQPEAAVTDLTLRKSPTKTGPIRVVAVVDFDRSPCGGTHVRATGELGLIKVRKWEHRTRGVRLEFLVGWRALRDYRWKNRLVNDLSADLSVKDTDLGEALGRLIAEGREARHALARLRERLLDYEALELLAVAAMIGPWRVVRHVFSARDVAQVKWLAQRLTTHEHTIALLGVAAEKGHLIFACAPGVPLDAGQLLQQACQSIGGRGGGRPDLAQGGVPDPRRVAETLDRALAEVERRAAPVGG